MREELALLARCLLGDAYAMGKGPDVSASIWDPCELSSSVSNLTSTSCLRFSLENVMFESDEKVELAFLIDDLNDLIQMHYDVMASYHEVLSKARGYNVKTVVEKLLNQHGMQVAALSGLIQRHGGEARSWSDAGKIKTKIRVAAGRLFRDAGMCAAMRTNERKLMQEYERGLLSLREIPGLEPVLARNYGSTKQRIAMLEDLLDRLQNQQLDVGAK